MTLSANERAPADAGEMFRAIFEHASDAILLFDGEGIIDCNPEALRVLRCADKSELLRSHPARFSPERQPCGRRSMDKSVDMDRSAREQGFHRFEWMHRRLDGELFPVEVTLSPLKLASGEALLAVWHDLSEFKARERALEQQLELIREQQRELRRRSMPLISVGAGALMVPVLGELDGSVLASLSEELLARIARAGAHTLILDLTGLARTSSEAAAALSGMIRATKLLGVETMVVGIQPQVARELVSIGAELAGARVLASMREALLHTRGA